MCPDVRCVMGGGGGGGGGEWGFRAQGMWTENQDSNKPKRFGTSTIVAQCKMLIYITEYLLR